MVHLPGARYQLDIEVLHREEADTEEGDWVQMLTATALARDIQDHHLRPDAAADRTHTPVRHPEPLRDAEAHQPEALPVEEEDHPATAAIAVAVAVAPEQGADQSVEIGMGDADDSGLREDVVAADMGAEISRTHAVRSVHYHRGKSVVLPSFSVGTR